MTDLRNALVEALDPGPKGYLSITADEAIDRILDVLADRADEWADAVARPEKAYVIAESVPKALIAVLRGDTE